MDEIVLEGGKYTLQMHDDGRMTSLRYDEPWRPLIGDKLACAMFDRIRELEAALKAQNAAAAKPKRMNTASMGEAGVVFADIRAAFVEADGSICRTVNGAILQPGTALYVLGDLIE